MQVIRKNKAHILMGGWGTAFPAASLAQVGFTLLRADGTVYQTRTTPEVQLGNNFFATSVIWNESMHGFVRWDINNNPATYVHEEFFVTNSRFVGNTFVNVPRTFLLMFPPSMPVSEIGYTFLDASGNMSAPRQTTGVVNLGNNQYAISHMFLDETRGILKWDADQAPTKIAFEEFNVNPTPPDVAVALGYVNSVQIRPSSLSKLERDAVKQPRTWQEHFWEIIIERD